ncbi:MAG: hypothetical protein IKO56_05125, partial [Alphaproteobacteria bacterium]|nr:hypothetical protein [Alphaproteobacteria bacterium]
MSFDIGYDVLPHEYKGAVYNRESANRLRWVKFGFVLMFCVFIARTLQLGLQSNDIGKYNGYANEIESRADIIDRNGVVLAKSVKSGNIKLFPGRVKDKDINEVANVIHEIAPMDYSVSDALNLIKSGKRGLYIKKNASEEQIKLVKEAHRKYNCFEVEQFTRRRYPQRNVFAHVVGFAGKDAGLEGVEYIYDEYLKENEDPLRLSIDSRVQNIFYEQLSIAMNKYQAKGAMGMLMNSSTGEM